MSPRIEMTAEQFSQTSQWLYEQYGRLVNEMMTEKPYLTQAQAQEAVLTEYPNMYSALMSFGDRVTIQRPAPNTAADEYDKRYNAAKRAYTEKVAELQRLYNIGYGEALAKVDQDYPELMQNYKREAEAWQQRRREQVQGVQSGR